MMATQRRVCPTCNGEKVVPGECSCSAEWSGTLVGDQWEACMCLPQKECPTCHGEGFVEVDAEAD